MFLARKYWPIPYILESCYLKNTQRQDGKVSVIGARKDIRPDIVMKKKKPMIEFHYWKFVQSKDPALKNSPPMNKARNTPWKTFDLSSMGLRNTFNMFLCINGITAYPQPFYIFLNETAELFLFCIFFYIFYF